MDNNTIAFPASVLRKEGFLPRYIVVKPKYVFGGTEAFRADVMLNAAGPFRRNIRPWGKGSDVFFFNLTAEHCKTAGLGTNDMCIVTMTLCE